MKLLKRTRKVWVSRDKAGEPLQYDVWDKEPDDDNGIYLNGNHLAQFCSRYFGRYFGMSLSPGECVQVRFSVEVVK